MPMDIDPAFQKTGARARARRKQRIAMRIAAVIGGLALVGAVGTIIVLIILNNTGPSADGAPETDVAALDTSDTAPAADFVADTGTGGDDDFIMIQTEGSAEAGIVAAAPAADAFLNLRKDPMILRLEQSETSVANTIAGPQGLDQRRVGPFSEDRLTVLTDDLIIQETRLVTTIPSSAEDFAFFQAQRSRGIAEIAEANASAASAAVVGEAGEGERVLVDGADGSWGELIDTGLEDAPVSDEVSYVDTVIENTTSSAFSLRESQRFVLYEDLVVVIRTERELAEVLTSNGFDQAPSELIANGAVRVMNIETKLSPGSLVAARYREDVTGRYLTQMSIYGPEGYIASMAQTGPGRFAPAADPWIETDLYAQTDDLLQEAASAGEVRLLDAVYSAAIRNGLPTTLVGELIVMMSQIHDLDRFAAVGDKVTILYGTNPVTDGQGPSRVLFAGINGPSGDMRCYITPDSETNGYSCFDFNGAGGGGGLVIPVAGTKTSDFGPRFHPILKQMRNHNGVDWAAPTGTPIVSSFDGTVEVSGWGGGYGNVVYIAHEGGLQTRYAHLDRYSELGSRVGNTVRAGDVIGYVGTTGRSTGPHLHFELRQNGTPIDPLTFTGSVGGGGGAGGYSDGGTPGSDAVEALVNQIIQVESAGNANAKNPLSTATGLGQFIESTWLRMMRTYRPDLVASMSRQQLLNLRTDPALSREMVRNLARENESFLRARGHTITPGRLYLAHFLGPGGAHTSLSAPGNSTVLQVMGAAVVNANPFLRNKTNADMWAWSDRKMRGASSAPAVGVGTSVTRSRAIPPEIKEYRDLVDAMLGLEDEG